MPRAPRPTRKRAPRPTKAHGVSSYIDAQLEAERYTARWHRVYAWAVDSLEPMDISRPPTKYHNRIETVRGIAVDDLTDDEEAFDRGIPLEWIDIAPGPAGQYRDKARAGGGRRRVMIRLLSWVVDKDNPIAFSPQWIVAGHGMSALAASASLGRYIRSYALAVSKGIESRRLVVTAMDVVWWTAPENTDYV